ncbi:sensor histidine kinase [Flavimaricola marinus]|uniref:C4-dicarboxylate transport sensor protein DctB n=1 Tax=Flavimaricola marinus TaxID=1819565 RepID=A0A238LEL5_9RHOB|nr:ATP-binding protein [Flavimaricola marinus]SMY07864.1 C4-dicarboxylate transport sensor protein DctB [Flavimaricola marinus]
MTGSKISRAGGVLAFLLLVAGFAAGVWTFGYREALDQMSRRGEADLALAADRLTAELQRFRELAVLMADHPDLTALITGGTGAEEAAELLRQVADKTGSLDIFLVDAEGRELVAAEPVSGVVTHVEAPYFDRAMQGALGVYHQLSDRYGRRTFMFAAPIFSVDGPVLGAVVVATDVEEVEAGWRGDRPTIFFTDEMGVIFVSNRSELLFRSRVGDPEEASQSLRYPAGRVTAFVSHSPGMVGVHEVWAVDGGPYVPARALHLTLPLPVIGLEGEALIDVAPARQVADLQAAVTAALCLAFGALLFLATERRRTLAEDNARLEARVADRTAELRAINADLIREVAERTAAEARLTKAQADLVQAGKLSALGQMSAGISHELNQPLMAIGSFAQNALAFLEKDRPDRAAENLSRIAELTRRMGRIIRNLRAFARQESAPLADVDLVPVVDVVLEMAGAKARQAEVEVVWRRPEAPVLVRGGEVRLQQVVLNLVTNAIDAMAASPERRVEIEIFPVDAARVAVSVRDTGPGISEPERIFDPFYSTKAVGAEEGMGLGLSISYGLVQSFGGAIRGRNHPDGGAVFTIELDLVARQEAAA